MTPEELESLRESVHEADPKIHAHVVRALLAMVDSLREELDGWRRGNEGIEVWKRVNRAAPDRAYKAEDESASLRQGVETLRKVADRLAWCHAKSNPNDDCDWLKQVYAALRETEGLVKP